MAEEVNEEPPEEKSSGPLGKIVLVLGVVLVAAIGGLATYLFVLKPMLEEAMHGPLLRGCGIFNSDKLDQILAEHLQSKRDHGPVLWSLLVFERFLRRHEGIKAISGGI